MMSIDDPGHLDVEALGHVIRLEWGQERDTALVDQLVLAWSDAAATFQAPHEATLVVRQGPMESVLEHVSTSLTQRALLLARGELLLLHAAGLADETGRTLAFVAASGTGKTTLASVLGRSLTYLSDETVGIATNQRVYPYRKPLSIIERNIHKTQRSASQQGLRVALEMQAKLAGIVLLRRRNESMGEPPVQCRRVPLFEALVEILPQTSYLDALENPLQIIAGLLERTGGALCLDYSEAEDVLAMYRGLFDVAPLNEPWEPCLPSPGRSLALDAITDGASIMLFSRTRQLLQLRGIGPLAWSLFVRGAGPEKVGAAITARFGAPDRIDPVDSAREIELELVRLGLLAA